MFFACFGRGPGDTASNVQHKTVHHHHRDASKSMAEPLIAPDPTHCLSTSEGIKGPKGSSEAPASQAQAASTRLEKPVASEARIPCAPAPDASWDSSLLEAIPLSVAVISSDTMEVLHHRCGSESGACQLLTQTLQRCNVTSTSFLACLLGPEVAAAALRTVREGRMWKGSMQIQLAQGGRTSSPTAACNNGGPSPAPVSCFLGKMSQRTGAAAGMEPQQQKSLESTAVVTELLAAEAAQLDPAAAAEAHGDQPGEREADQTDAGLSLAESAFAMESTTSGGAWGTTTAASIDIQNPAGSKAAGKSVQWRCSQGQVEGQRQPPTFVRSSASLHSPFSSYERSSHGKTCGRARHSANEVDKDGGTVPSGGLECSSSAQAPQAKGKRKVKKSKSFSSAKSEQPSRRSSIVMSEKAMEWLMRSEEGACENGSPNSKRTLTFLRQLSKQLDLVHEDSMGNQRAGLSTSPGNFLAECRPSSSRPGRSSFSGCSSTPSMDGTSPAHTQSSLQAANQHKYSFRKLSGSLGTSGPHIFRSAQSLDSCRARNGQGDGCASNSQVASTSGEGHSTQVPCSSDLVQFPIDEAEDEEEDTGNGSSQQPPLETFSFDIIVTQLRPKEGLRSPLLVAMTNTTEHLHVRATLSSLAESQLELISSIIPQHAVQFLALESTAAVPTAVGQLARAHKGVTLMFMDIVGFTSMAKAVEPQDVMVFLNTLFSLFDQLTDVYGVHKVETAGDCYIVSGGIMCAKQAANGCGLVVEEEQVDPAESAKRVMDFAKALLEVAEQVRMPDTQQPVRVRVGLHTGNCVSGLIGSKLPKFSVFGDTMNTASRMESTGVPGRIHVSEFTHALLQHEKWEPTPNGGVQVKGKGMMQTYLWVPDPTSGPTQKVQTGPLPTVTSEMLPCTLIKTTQALMQQLSISSTVCPPSDQRHSPQLEDPLVVAIGDANEQ